MPPRDSRQPAEPGRKDHSDEPDWSPGSPAATIPTDAITVPGYRDLVAVASGGDSIVYRARQEGLDRYVAVKVLLRYDAAALARFERELEITVRLGQQHPNIVTVLDTATTNTGQPCLVMEYYELGSLHDHLRSYGPLARHEVAAAGAVVADALSYAHGQGLLHRDVKPQNILLLPTSYVLADFGIARPADAGHSVSLEHFSYRHAAPQVLDGEPPTAADDIYSLGSTLFTLLDGRPPFASDDPDADGALAYLRRVRSEPPRALDRPDVPAGLRAAIIRCLARDRQDRYPDAAELSRALAAVPGRAPDWAPPETALPQPVPPPPPVAPPAPSPEPAPSGNVQPVAASALAHLDVGTDDGTPEHTGNRPSEPPPAPSPTPIEKPRRRSWRRVAAVAVAALVLGVALGVIGTWLRDGSAEDTPEQAGGSVGQPVPSFTGPLPSQVGPPQADIGDPQLAPRINGLDDRGTSVVLRWTDPTDGVATFVVIRRVGEDSQPLVTVAPGTTTELIEGLDPAVQQYCFQVVAIIDSERFGVSAQRCVSR